MTELWGKNPSFSACLKHRSYVEFSKSPMLLELQLLIPPIMTLLSPVSRSIPYSSVLNDRVLNYYQTSLSETSTPVVP